MQSVFDRAPVTAGDVQQALGIRLMAIQGRDEADRFRGLLSLDRSFTFDCADLLDTGPVEVIFQGSGTGQGSSFETAVTLIERRGRLLFGLSLTLCVGGKRPPLRQPVRA